jgi:hypothetical protein
MAAASPQGGRPTQFGYRQTVPRSEEDGPPLADEGLGGLSVVAMRDAVLVVDMAGLQAVKDADAREAETFPRTHSPRGGPERLGFDRRFRLPLTRSAPTVGVGGRARSPWLGARSVLMLVAFVDHRRKFGLRNLEPNMETTMTDERMAQIERLRSRPMET